MKADKPQLDPAQDWEKFLEEFQNESPRACVILGAAFLDIKLRELIASFLINERKVVDDLLGTEKKVDSPLATFSARIRAAYCLGLVSKEQFDDLNVIRKIRNQFAHRLHDLSFDDNKIRDWCNSLKIPKKIVREEWRLSHKDFFVAAVALLSNQLEMAAIEARGNRRTVRAGTGEPQRLTVTWADES